MVDTNTVFQKNSYTIPSDSSGIYLVRVIETRRCSSLRHAKLAKFLKVVIKNTKTELLKRRRKKNRAIVIRSKHYFKKIDGLYCFFVDNGLIVLKKRMNTFGKELYGPTAKSLKIRKFRVAFKAVF